MRSVAAEFRFFAKSKLYSDSDPQISAQSRGIGYAAAKVQRVRGGGMEMQQLRLLKTVSCSSMLTVC